METIQEAINEVRELIRKLYSVNSALRMVRLQTTLDAESWKKVVQSFSAIM